MTQGLHDMAAALASGEVSSLELTLAALDRARERQDDVGAFVEITERLAVKAARRADSEIRFGGSRGPFHGIPVAVKDVIDVEGTVTRNGTEGLGHHWADKDAAAWARLSRAGAVLIGRTRTHELAWGMRTPLCRNPLDTSRTTGGSSGGSAAAVAAGVVPVALGTDTGGSVRNPAALCGVSGLKPTWGVAPLTGISPLARSQDVVGAIAARPMDCLVTLQIMSGHVTPTPPAGHRVLRVGLLANSWATRVERQVAAALGDAAAHLERSGVDVVTTHLPPGRLAPAASFVVMLAESAAAWWPQTVRCPSGVSDEVRALLRVGATLPAIDYMQARRVSGHLRRTVLQHMDDQQLDALLLPTAPATAAPADSQEQTVAHRTEPLSSAHSRLTALASVTGLPALSVPCGLDDGDLPIGAQLIGRAGSEPALCALGQLLDEGEGGRAVAARRARGVRRASTPGGSADMGEP